MNGCNILENKRTFSKIGKIWDSVYTLGIFNVNTKTKDYFEALKVFKYAPGGV